MAEHTYAERIEHLWNESPKHRGKRLAKWAKEGKTRKERARRWEAIEEFAHHHAVTAAEAQDMARWRFFHKLRVWAGGVAKRIRKRIKRSHDHADSGWPADMHITELFNNDNALHNHVHIASTERDKLIQLANIAIAQYGGAGAIREFPPFDPVECVHVSSSWHYRDSGSPYTVRACANRGDGCAMDLGFARRQEFANEVKRRYGADACDF